MQFLDKENHNLELLHVNKPPVRQLQIRNDRQGQKREHTEGMFYSLSPLHLLSGGGGKWSVDKAIADGMK